MKKTELQYGLHSRSGGRPLVGVIMGSDSDLSVMKQAAEAMDEFKVPYEITVVSAHRTPERMVQYAKSAHDRGLQVIIAGAGGAAHLPGMVASICALPVIGVPIKTTKLSGLDSLFSIVQMPEGIPVATVAINGGRNAGLLACEILGASNEALHRQMKDYKRKLRVKVELKARELELKGYKKYLAELEKVNR